MTPFQGPLRSVLFATSALTLIALPGALAQEQQVAAAGIDLGSETVTVTATKTEKKTDEVPATVTVFTAEEIADRLVDNVKDLIRFEPGLSVRTQPARFTAALATTGRDGNSSFNIRGLEGNRVLVQVDGVRIPDAYAFGAQSVGRGDYVDLDLLKSVEVLRGPASALYGSDGLAGAVSFMTKDPGDFLKGDRNWYAQMQGGYASADQGLSGGFVGAARSGEWEAMVAYTHRESEGQETQGTNDSANTDRTTANPEENVSDALLAKLVFTPDANNRLRLTLDSLRQDIDWNVLSAISKPPLASTSVLGLTARDEVERDRITLDHEYSGTGFIKSARSNIYYQDSTTRQISWEDRNTAVDRIRDSTFDNTVWGLGTTLESEFTTGSVKHLLVYGADYSVTEQQSIRSGTVPPAGETFPTKPFPDTDYTLAGFYVQDEIAVLDGALTFFPAVRFDYYQLDPVTSDALYAGPTPTESSDNHWSPKLGIVWKINDTFGVFLNLAEGFKAPAPSQVNTNFSNPTQFYVSISNPDLKPETSQTIEGGFRFGGDAWSASVTGYYGTYDDFISQVQVRGNFASGDPAVYQYVNLPGVEIYGFEGRAEGQFGNGFSAIAAFSYSHGISKTSGVETPLQTIDPVKFSAGLNYRDPDGRFGGQLAAVYSARKDAEDACAVAATCTLFRPDSFTVLDLTAWVQLGDHAKLRGGIFNLTDEKYWWWSDVRGIAATSTTLDAYTQPGRNYAVSLTVSF
ncbi:Vitamin B12 transporter BtuB [Alphaproteobacteria bacterium SO-S41]|nr:Vitamin B12 transporter BtuB [Alphaproteobacteria bacterium SO-S41]